MLLNRIVSSFNDNFLLKLNSGDVGLSGSSKKDLSLEFLFDYWINELFKDD